MSQTRSTLRELARQYANGLIDRSRYLRHRSRLLDHGELPPDEEHDPGDDTLPNGEPVDPSLVRGQAAEEPARPLRHLATLILMALLIASLYILSQSKRESTHAPATEPDPAAVTDGQHEPRGQLPVVEE